MANSLKSLVKTGFGLGLGVYLAQLVFVVIGLAVFLPGYSMLQQKNKANAPTSEKLVPLVLMGIGVVLLGGGGLGLLAESAGDLFD